MKQLYQHLAILALFLGGIASGQQTETKVSASEAMRHVSKSVRPDYPASAAGAHIQGRVILQISISPEGKVTAARRLSGHPLFEPSAIHAVSQWRYEPFIVEGAAAPVSTYVYLLFTESPQAELQQK